MEKRVIKYLEQREAIIKIIESHDFLFETDDCAHMVSVDFWKAKLMAEKILSKMGINMPQFVKEQENSGMAINSKFNPNE